MYTVYFAACIGALLELLLTRLDKPSSIHDQPRKPSWYVKIALVGIAFGAFIGALVAICLMEPIVPRRTVLGDQVKLVAMRSSEGLSGAFILGTGSAGSAMTYNFYRRNADGSLTPGQVPADDRVRIVEDKTLKDVGYWRTTVAEYDLSSARAHWALDLSSDGNGTVVVKQEFRVPVGTVVQNFSVK